MNNKNLINNIVAELNYAITDTVYRKEINNKEIIIIYSKLIELLFFTTKCLDSWRLQQ